MLNGYLEITISSIYLTGDIKKVCDKLIFDKHYIRLARYKERQIIVNYIQF